MFSDEETGFLGLVADTGVYVGVEDVDGDACHYYYGAEEYHDSLYGWVVAFIDGFK